MGWSMSCHDYGSNADGAIFSEFGYLVFFVDWIGLRVGFLGLWFGSFLGCGVWGRGYFGGFFWVFWAILCTLL